MARVHLTVPQVYDSERADRSLLQRLTDYDTALDALELGGGGISGSINALARGADNTGGASISQLARDLVTEADAAGGQEIFFPRGLYKVTKIDLTCGILIDSPKSNITIRGEKGTIFLQSGSLNGAFSQILVYGGRRVHIKDIEFHMGGVTDVGLDEQIFHINVGPTPSAGVDHVIIEGCYFGTNIGDGIRCIGESGREVRRVTIRNNTFDGFDNSYTTAYDQGLRAAIGGQRYVQQWVITGNHMRGADDALLDLEPTSAGELQDLIVANNIIDHRGPHPNPASQVANAATIVAPTNLPMRRAVVTGNIILGGRLQFGACKDLICSNNYISGGIWTEADQVLGIIGQCERAQITGNTIVNEETSPPVGQFAVSIKSDGGLYPSEVVFADNNVLWNDSASPGMNVQACASLTVANNQFRCIDGSVGAHNGINVVPGAEVESLTITGNTLRVTGGGSMNAGVRIASTANLRNVVVNGNSIRGFTNGVAIEKNAAAAFLRPPVVAGNTMDATTAVQFVNAPGPVVIGGNSGGAVDAIGTFTTPEANVDLPLGSTYRSQVATAKVFVRETLGGGSTGWVQK